MMISRSVAFSIWVLATAFLLGGQPGSAQLVAGLDLPFGGNGNGTAIATLAGFTTQTFGSARQSDGKILLAGQAWGGGTTYRMVIARLNVDGTLDTTFGASGFFTYGPTAGLNYAARCVRELSDGKILVAGDASGSAMTLRLLSTGAIDVTYSGGISTSLGTNGQVTGLALQSDGKALVSAFALRSGNVDNDGIILRYNASGTLDTSFASSGRFTYGGTGEQTVTAVVILPDGKSLHTGSTGSDMYVTRLTTGGSLDNTFRSTGRVNISAVPSTLVTEGGRAMALEPDGSIVVVGQSNPGSANEILLARLTSAGSLDTTFSSDGMLLTNFGGASGMPTGVAVQADGRILISGHRPIGSPTGVALRRFYWNGHDDTTFDSDGLLTAAIGTSHSDSAGLFIQPDGKIVVAGSALASGFLRGAAAVRLGPGAPLEPVAVTITQDPVDKTVTLGTPVTFSVTADSSLPLVYSWYRNSQLLIRSESPTYNIGAAAFANEGTYHVEARHGTNFALSGSAILKIVSPPVIGSQNTVETRALAGSQAQLYVTFSGRTPFTCEWFKGNQLVQSNVTSGYSSTLTLSPVSETSAGVYRLVITNADGSVPSLEHTVTVRPDPSIDLVSQGYLIEAGGYASLEASINATGSYRLQWTKNGAVLALGSNAAFEIPSAKLTDAGTYKLSLRSLKAAVLSDAVQVAVVDVAPATHVAALNKKFSMTVPSAGPGVTYLWSRNGQAVIADSRISGEDSATLSFKTVAADDAGQYTCRVSAYGQSKDAGPYALAVTGAVPSVGGFTLPAARVGLLYYHTPTLPALTTHLEMTGLPAGLTYAKTTNRLEGKPVKPGTYQVKVVAVNPVGKSAPTLVPLVVETLAVGKDGRYFTTFVDDYLDGIVDLTVTASGAYSGKIQISNRKGAMNTASFKGAFSVDAGEAEVAGIPTSLPSTTTAAIAGVIPKILGPSTVNILLRDGYLEFTVSIPFYDSENQTPSSRTVYITASHCPWTAKAPLPANSQGAFHVGLTASGGGGPEGAGYAKITSAASGAITVAGKLSDNTALTCTFPLTVDRWGNGLAFLYGNRGCLSVGLQVIPGTSGPDYLDAGITNGSASWIKAPNPASTSSYPSGFAVGLSFEGGGKYLKPNMPLLTGPVPMNGGSGPDNVWVSMLGNSTNGTLGANGSVAFSKLPEFNPLGFSSIKFNTAAGTFSGSAVFTFQEERYDSDGYPYYVTVRRPFTVQGMVIRSPAEISSYAVGFGLLQQPLAENPAKMTNASYLISVGPNY